MRKLRNEELDRLSISGFKKAGKLPLVVVLDNVRSLLNVGGVFRTADAFRIEGIFLCGITARPPHREIRKTALGATESVDWAYFEHAGEAVDRLRCDGYEVIAVEHTENNTSLMNFRPERERSYGLVFGHEVNGVQQSVLNACDGCIEIPQFGTKHSLNVAVSAGIVLWDLYSKMRL